MPIIRKNLVLKNVVVAAGAALILILYLLAYLTTHQEDFRIYLEASEAIKAGQDIYLATSNQYVYGPFLAVLLLPLTMFKVEIAKIIWGIANLISVFVIVLLINKLRKKRNRSPISYPILLVIFLSSFSFRNNFGQGQAVTLVVIFWLFAVLLSKSEINFVLKYILVSLFTIGILEIKPYLGLGLILYFLILKNHKFIFSLGLTVLGVHFFYQKFLAVNYFTWLDSLKLRSETVIDGNDQASLLTLLKVNFGVSNSFAITSFFMFLILITFVLFRKRQTLVNELESFTMIIPLVISPFMHAHDLLLGLAGFALILDLTRKATRTQLVLLLSLLVLHVGWTSDVLIAGVLILGILILSLWAWASRLKFKASALMFLLGFVQLMTLHSAFSISDYSRIRAYNFLALLEGVILLILASTATKPQNDEMSVLSLPRDNIGLDS